MILSGPDEKVRLAEAGAGVLPVGPSWTSQIISVINIVSNYADNEKQTWREKINHLASNPTNKGG